MIGIIIFGASNIDGFSFGIEGYDIYHHLPTPSLPLTIEIIISVNDDNDGRPLKRYFLPSIFLSLCVFDISQN